MKGSGYLAVGLGVVSAGLIVAAGLTPASGQSIGKADTPLKVAEVLDCLVQPRFESVQDKFGAMDRLVKVQGHTPVRLAADTPLEKKYLRMAGEANRDYFVSFLHVVHVPSSAYRGTGGKPEPMPANAYAHYKTPEDTPSLRFVSAVNRDGYSKWVRISREWEKAAVGVLPRLKKGESVNADQADWLLAMRPVKASKQECLGCHTKSKLGDTLGVMVYAVSKKMLDTKVGRNATL
jgi:hypothetical protein